MVTEQAVESKAQKYSQELQHHQLANVQKELSDFSKEHPAEFNRLVASMKSSLGSQLGVETDGKDSVTHLNFDHHDIYKSATTTDGSTQSQTAGDSKRQTTGDNKGQTAGDSKGQTTADSKGARTEEAMDKNGVVTRKERRFNADGSEQDPKKVIDDATKENATAIEKALKDTKNPDTSRTAGFSHTKELFDLFVPSTYEAPATQDSSLAKATRPYEERLMKILNGEDKEIKLTNEEKQSLSQEKLASIAGQITPDREMAILTMANFTKNLTGRERALLGERNRVDTTRIKDEELKKTYSDDNVRRACNQLQTINGQGKFSDGETYHFWGSVLAGYSGGEGGAIAARSQQELKYPGTNKYVFPGGHTVQKLDAGKEGGRIGADMSPPGSPSKLAEQFMLEAAMSPMPML